MSQYNGIEYSLRKREGSKFYFVDFYLRGRRKRVSLKTADKALAMIKAKTILSRYVEHEIPTNSVSVSEFKRKYIDHIGARLRPRTVAAQTLALDHFFTFRDFAHISHITPKDVDEFMTYLLTRTGKDVKPMAPISVNTNIRMLRQVFNQALRWEYIVDNPFNRVKLLRYQQPVVRVLSAAEIGKLLAAFDEHHPQYADVIRFYLLTGMRLSEPLGMTWKNVHFDENYIELTWTKGKYNRRIPLLPATRAILEQRRNFPRPFAHSDSRLINAMSDACKLAGIEPATIQNLRSTAYSYMVKIGVPQPLIRKIIGHTGDRVGQIHYFNMDSAEVLTKTSGLQDIISSGTPIGTQ